MRGSKSMAVSSTTKPTCANCTRFSTAVKASPGNQTQTSGAILAMSVQFGRWNFDGQPCAAEYLEKVRTTLAPYGPDTDEVYAKDGVQILYRAFHTTKESHRETQPHISPSGAVITWDGRLDNRAELVSELGGLLNTNAATAGSVGWSSQKATAQLVAASFAKMNSVHEFTDVKIVAGAYEKWGAECLGRVIGDWALSIWNPRQCSLL